MTPVCTSFDRRRIPHTFRLELCFCCRSSVFCIVAPANVAPKQQTVVAKHDQGIPLIPHHEPLLGWEFLGGFYTQFQTTHDDETDSSKCACCLILCSQMELDEI